MLKSFIFYFTNKHLLFNNVNMVPKVLVVTIAQLAMHMDYTKA